MDNKSDIIFFLPYWDAKNPTLEDKTSFIIGEIVAVDECEELGGYAYVNSQYACSNKTPKDFIKDVIRKDRPKWVVGIENTATLLLSYHRQKKILINPTVTMNDLNWVTPETIRDTYAFFSAKYEKDYEIYSKVYRNVAYYPAQQTLFIADLAPLIKAILFENN